MHSVMGIGATSVYMVLMLARTVYATHQGGINHLHTFSSYSKYFVGENKGRLRTHKMYEIHEIHEIRQQRLFVGEFSVFKREPLYWRE